MPVVSRTDLNQLSSVEICDHIQQKFYTEIRRLLHAIQGNLQRLAQETANLERAELFNLLFLKLQEEVGQMMRNDELIIFPIIRNDKQVSPCPARKLPVEMIRQKHQKIMLLLEKIRQQANNYLPKPGWEQVFVVCCSDMYTLEQELQRAIYTKEIDLFQKIEKQFNQPCSGKCKH